MTAKITDRQWENLTPLARRVFITMNKLGSMSAMDATRALGITSSSFTRRLTELEELGIQVDREKKKDPITSVRYTRYSFTRQGLQAAA